MNAWETLVASALVGTDRQSPAIDFTAPALTDYQTSLQSQSATQQILSAAGLIAAYQAVGQSTATANLPLSAAASSEQLICCSPQTTQHLSTVLQENRYAEILPELLQLLAQFQQTVPPDFLPLLLDAGKKNKQLRPLILPILGHLGQWLARQNRQWEYGLGAKIADVDLASIQEIWATGNRSERSAALSQWRKLQPVESRQALEASWKTEKADDRAAWLEILQIDLSLKDKEFLEMALVDRSKVVSHQAAHLLTQLPGNYSQRLTQMISKCLVIKNLKGVYQIEINLPKAEDKEWQEVIINLTVNSSFLNVADRRFVQALSATDLSFWPGDIDRLLAAVMDLDDKFVILKGWAMAACYQQRIDWIEALLTQADGFLDYDDIQRLWQCLPGNVRSHKERIFTRLLNADDLMEKVEGVLEKMMAAERHWGMEISSLAMQEFDKVVRHTNYYYLRTVSAKMASYLDIGVLPDVQRMQATLSSEKFSYDGCIEILEFRRKMHEAFNTE
jgi:hypothetical protein